MAVKSFTGNAVPVKQVDTFTVSGVWAAADTATITINGKDLVITIGSLVTTAEVATTIQQVLSKTTLTDTTATQSTASADLDQFFPELAEITWTVSSSTVTGTSKSTVGEPFTFTISETTAGTGSLGTITAAVAPTGPHHWDNVDNWADGSLPADTDEIDLSNIDAGGGIFWGLSQGAITPTSFSTTETFKGTIGRPDIHRSTTSVYTYREYRGTHLVLGNATDANPTTININSSGSGRIRYDAADSQVTVNVLAMGQSLDSGQPAFQFKGTHASNVMNVSKGTVGVALAAGETATIATLRVGYVDNQQGDAVVTLGSGVTLTDVDQSGGTLTVDSATTTFDLNGGTVVVTDAAHASFNINAGTLDYRSNGTITTLAVAGGATVDFSRDQRAKTVTNCTVSRGATLKDANGVVTFTNGIDLQKCRINDTTIDVGVNKTLTPSAI